jgi:hypothetical protein
VCTSIQQLTVLHLLCPGVLLLCLHAAVSVAKRAHCPGKAHAVFMQQPTHSFTYVVAGCAAASLCCCCSCCCVPCRWLLVSTAAGEAAQHGKNKIGWWLIQSSMQGTLFLHAMSPHVMFQPNRVCIYQTILLLWMPSLRPVYGSTLQLEHLHTVEHAVSAVSNSVQLPTVCAPAKRLPPPCERDPFPLEPLQPAVAVC